MFGTSIDALSLFEALHPSATAGTQSIVSAHYTAVNGLVTPSQMLQLFCLLTVTQRFLAALVICNASLSAVNLQGTVFTLAQLKIVSTIKNLICRYFYDCEM